MKRLILVVVLVACALAAWNISQRFSPEEVQARLIQVVRQATGMPVKIGRTSLAWNGELVVTDMTVGDPGIASGFRFTVARATADLDLKTLIRGRLDVRSLALEKPRVDIDSGLAGAIIKKILNEPPFFRLPCDRLSWRSLRLAIAHDGPGTTAEIEIDDPGREVTPADVKTLLTAKVLHVPSDWTARLSGRILGAGARIPVSASVRFPSCRLAREADGVLLGGFELGIGSTRLAPTVRVRSGKIRVEVALPPARYALPELVTILPEPWGAQVRDLEPRGQIELTAAVSGEPSSPEMAGELKLIDVDLALPGTADRVQAQRGSIVIVPATSGGVVLNPQGVDLTWQHRAETCKVSVKGGDLVIRGDRLEVQDLTVALARASGAALAEKLTFGGRLSRGPSGPELSIDLSARKADVAGIFALARPSLSAPLAANGVTAKGDLDLTVTGRLSEPVVAGTAKITEGSFSIGDGKIPAAVAPGSTLAITRRSVRLEHVSFTSQDLRVNATGEIVKDALKILLEARDVEWAKLARFMDPSPEVKKSLSGRVAGVKVDLSGGPGALRAQTRLEVGGLKIARPQWKEPLSLASGEAAIGSGRIDLANLKGEFGDDPIEIDGNIVFGKEPAKGEPQLDLKIRSKSLAPATFAGALAKNLALKGRSAVELVLEGPASDPKVTGRVSLSGLEARPGSLSKAVTCDRGELEISGKSIRTRKARVVYGEAPLDLELEASVEHDKPVVKRLLVSGPIDLGTVAGGSRDMGIEGKARIELSASGPASDLVASGKIQAGQLKLTTGGRTTELSDFMAQLSVDEGEVEVPAFECKARGAAVRGAVEADGTVTLKVTGLDLKKLPVDPASMWKSGVFSVELTGNADQGMSDLEVKGKASVTGLEVDMTQSKTLAKMKHRAGAGEAGSVIAGQLLSTTGLGLLAGASAAQAHFFTEVLEEALGRHTVGTVSSPFTYKAGKLDFPDIKGENAKGRLTCQFPSGKIEGRLEFVQLGKARFLDVKLAGIVGDVEPTVSPTDVRLGGKGAPGGKGSGQSALNLKTIVKPGMGLVFGWPVAAADLLIPRLFGRHKHRRKRQPEPVPSPEASPSPSPTPTPSPSPATGP